MVSRQRTVFFLLFALSGFSGLIYESIWTHYLKLFLGHSAYAQTLVLAIFMAGMAIGSWICSSFSARWRNVLLGYAFAEGVIGLFALVFHSAFAQIVELSYSTIIPQLGNPGVVTAFKWTISAVMILPQSILLGMTFPLMSSGVLRIFPEKPGRSVAMLYFTNSIGAAIGVLASGFILIRIAGLPGTIRIAGLINTGLALIVWVLVKDLQHGAVLREADNRTASRFPGSLGYRFFLLASLVTGAASFIYEIGWIRMLSLVLGSTTHAFELMLSAFIFGLAFGGFWIQRRIDQIAFPVRFLARVQVIMGLLALFSLLLYGNTFEVMQWLVLNLSKTDTGYALFNLSSSAIAMAVMLPATFCAGTTLPLITFVLIKRGDGERSIGAVYAANTVGAILGVFFAIHLGMPLLGLKGLITLGAGLDITLGFALLWSAAAGNRSYRLPALVTAAGSCALAATLLFVNLDPYKMGSGIYRNGVLSTPAMSKLLYHKDGKTATISCFLNSLGIMSIRTNGKTDAGIVMEGPANADEETTILLAAIPMALNPQASTAASIGLGSGLTTQTLLGNPLLREIDTVEIEEDVVDAAKNFGARVDLVYTDPRSKIYIDDAKTFFSTYNKKYDLIISEPSNPWVSGVAGLFSEEFYRLIRHYMNENGLFVQWVQLYEIDPELVVSVLKAAADSFSDFAVYAMNDSDMMIIARKNGLVPSVDGNILRTPAIASALKRIRIEGEQDIALRKIGTKKFLSRFLDSFPIRANSDYYPVLDQNAGRARFLESSARELIDFTYIPLPALALLTREIAPWKDTHISPSPFFSKSQSAFTAMAVRDYFLSSKYDPGRSTDTIMQQAVKLRQFFARHASLDENAELASLSVTSVNTTPFLTPHELESIWKKLGSSASASLAAREKQWHELFRAVGRRDADEMVTASSALLEIGKEWSSSALKYLVASGMLGSLLQGNREESYRLWTTYKASMFGNEEPDLLFRLLAAESTTRR